MDVLKIVLLIFLASATLTVAFVFVRNSRARGFPTPRSSSHFDQIAYGAGPPMPTPGHFEDGDAESSDGESSNQV